MRIWPARRERFQQSTGSGMRTGRTATVLCRGLAVRDGRQRPVRLGGSLTDGPTGRKPSARWATPGRGIR